MPLGRRPSAEVELTSCEGTARELHRQIVQRTYVIVLVPGIPRLLPHPTYGETPSELTVVSFQLANLPGISTVAS
jgi:hypothetical protein